MLINIMFHRIFFLFAIIGFVGCTNMRQNDEMLKVYNDIAEFYNKWALSEWTDYADALDYTITFSTQLQSIDLDDVTPEFKAAINRMSESLNPLIEALKRGDDDIDFDTFIENVSQMHDQLWDIAKENGAEWEKK